MNEELYKRLSYDNRTEYLMLHEHYSDMSTEQMYIIVAVSLFIGGLIMYGTSEGIILTGASYIVLILTLMFCLLTYNKVSKLNKEFWDKI